MKKSVERSLKNEQQVALFLLCTDFNPEFLADNIFKFGREKSEEFRLKHRLQHAVILPWYMDNHKVVLLRAVSKDWTTKQTTSDILRWVHTNQTSNHLKLYFSRTRFAKRKPIQPNKI